MARRLIVVVGGQYGSEGKGALCAHLGDTLETGSLVVRTGGPNAGHTAYDPSGRRFALRMIGTPAVRRADLHMALAPRAVVDPGVLGDECTQLGRTVLVDPHATWLTPEHIAMEQGENQLQTGSTRKGIGAARIERLRRTGPTMAEFTGDTNIVLDSIPDLIEAALDDGRDVLIEAAQGYGLGLHTDSYPHTTSADCTVMDALADCHITPDTLAAFNLEPWVALRPFPIRIAGASGPLAHETTWEDLGLPEEYTTVTKKVRRVGYWDPDLARASVIAAGGWMANICLTMVDQVWPAVAGCTTWEQIEEKLTESGRMNEFVTWTRDLRASTKDAIAHIDALGTGPQTMAFPRTSVERMKP